MSTSMHLTYFVCITDKTSHVWQGLPGCNSTQKWDSVYAPKTLVPAKQDSLGGNAKTSLVVAVSDAVDHVDETLQSLQFGVRAMCVKIQVSQTRPRV